MVGCCRRERQCLIFNSYIGHILIAVTVRFQKNRTVFLCPVSCQVRIVPIFYRLFRHFAHSQPQHLVVSYSRLFDIRIQRRRIMQYTDSRFDRRLDFHLLSSSGCVGCAEGFLYSCTGASAHRPCVCCRSQTDPKGTDFSDANLSDVQRSPARPNGRQSQNNGAASFSPLTAILMIAGL